MYCFKRAYVASGVSVSVIIDRVEEGLEMEVIHVMFYNDVYVVALGPVVIKFWAPPCLGPLRA